MFFVAELVNLKTTKIIFFHNKNCINMYSKINYSGIMKKYMSDDAQLFVNCCIA